MATATATEKKGEAKNGAEKVWREWGIAVGITILAVAIVYFYVRYFDGGGGGSRATLRGIDGRPGDAESDFFPDTLAS
jgi:hypothetical protein